MLDEKALEFFYKRLSWVTDRYKSTTIETLEQRLARALQETAGNDGLWFADQVNDFVRAVTLIISISDLGQAITQAWSEFFKDVSKTILLPPKRQLELTQTVDSNQEIVPSGGGVLNALFYAKNQDASSALHQNYQLLSRTFEEISSGYTFAVFFEHQNKVSLSFAYGGKPYIPVKDCGLGLQDLLVILFFSLNPAYKLILVEEPESHLHPD